MRRKLQETFVTYRHGARVHQAGNPRACISTSSSSGSAPTASPPRRRPTSASRSTSSRSPKPRRSRRAARRPRSYNPIIESAGRHRAPHLRAAPHARARLHRRGHRRRGQRRKSVRRGRTAPLADVEAPYVAEMARLESRSRFGPAAESAGYKVYTTIDGRLQAAANRALRIGLIDYDRRHGWRGAAGKVELTRQRDAGDARRRCWTNTAASACSCRPSSCRSRDKQARVSTSRARARRRSTGTGCPGRASDAQRDRARARAEDRRARSSRAATWSTWSHETDGARRSSAQMPEAQSALVALDPNDGAIVVAGGRLRLLRPEQVQPRDAGAAPAGLGFQAVPVLRGARERLHAGDRCILDAPVVHGRRRLEDVLAAGEFRRRLPRPDAPARSAGAVAQPRVDPAAASRWASGTAIDYVTRFGFDASDALPQNLTLALGTMQATPLEVATGYAVFANGGYR